MQAHPGTHSTGRSWASSAAIRRSMQGYRYRDTSLELAVRSLLHARGWRYRVSRRPVGAVRRTADLVIGPARGKTGNGTAVWT